MSSQDMKQEIEEEPYGLGCALELFKEAQEVLFMIDNIKNVYQDSTVREKTFEKFHFIIGQYKEQPHLLDTNLDKILQRFIDIIRNEEFSMELKHSTFDYLFVVVNVRGYKTIVRNLPHEVSDFEVVLQLLEKQDPVDPTTWTTRYILLLWLSIIVMIPFHLSRFDDGTYGKTIMSRVLDIIKTYAIVSDKCRDAAAYLSSRFLTRNDVKEQHLTSYFDWCTAVTLGPESTVFMKYGALASVGMILKYGKREDLLPYAPRLLQFIVNEETKHNAGTNVQKLVYKVVQRIGLIFLPPRVATWRYKRGTRSLATNLSGGDGSSSSQAETPPEDSTDDDIHVPDEIEEVIDQLINGLRSTDGIVRWSAAKGVGRVTGRLPEDFADDVVGSVLELFSPREGDGAWHGGCLALAELGRRGLLLPKRLPEVVPVVLEALVYDEPRGYSSVGSHIRDAACYVCWSFARAYETQVFSPFVNRIAATLLVVTCFDREINCRRAASAAFQENVGRQGTFPHGIDILTVADFFAVSVRNNSFLHISVHIAQHEEYTIPLIDHLTKKKVNHWDGAIREITAKALHNLSEKAPEYMVTHVIPKLFEYAHSIDLNSRHGAVLAIGEIVYALSKIAKSQKKNIEDLIGSAVINECKSLIEDYQKKLYFRGLGGELMRQACCDFITKCSLSSLNLQNDNNLIDQWLNLINECISYNVPNIQQSAVNALPVFLTEYFSADHFTNKRNEIVHKYLHELASTTVQETRIGYALALGSLPKFLLQDHLEKIIDALIESIKMTPMSLKWAESRRDAIKALTNISVTMTEEIGKDFSSAYVLKIYDIFMEGLKDYTQDKRGDVGAWVRESSMTGLQVVTLKVVVHNPEILTSDLIGNILPAVAQQSVEKIDRTRAIAGKVFYGFVKSEPSIPNFPNYKEIVKIFEECDNLNWNSAADTYPKFVELLQFPSYTYNVMLGLICSVGGMTETLVKNSSSSLFEYMTKEEDAKGPAEIERLCRIIHDVFKNNQKNDRITVSLFRFLDKLFSSGCIGSVIDNPENDFSKVIFKLILAEITGCKDLYKLIDGINVLAQFIQIKSEVCQSALVQLSILLCHRQTYVRKSTSTILYEALLIYGDDNSHFKCENLAPVLQLLSTTNWERPVEEVKPIRNELCALLGVRVPVSKIKTST